MRCSLAIVLLIFAAPASATPISLYLVAGQSNAAGQAADPPPAALARQAVPYEFWLRSLDYVYDVREPMDLQTLRPFWPLYQWSTYGPELGFAAAMSGRGEAVAVVKVAQGGVNAFAWQPGVTNLYDQLVASTREMLADLEGLGYEPAIGGLLWVQGEADAAQNQWTGANYERHLRTIFTRLREDLGDFPIALNRLHASLAGDGFQWANEVRSAQEAVAASLPAVGVVSIDDLGLQADGVHFTGATQVALGRRFANWFCPSGDFNFDGAVNEADLPVWAAGLGDGNGDGVTDGGDFMLWQRQLSGSVAAVPEPGALTLALVALVLAAAKRPYSAR